MNLQEPKVEFVPIDQNVMTTETSVGGGQRCIASQVDAHPCSDWDTTIPW